ncbi:CPBP family intramembrane glutamic endopeptidase [Paenibacillus albus]|uniref:CPBP family intramembrane metalloprotease n=1 Tax=Paenibacillus albus TaxID=2495582 RepID=A0A3Q8X4P1_9BACL|nr:CPBP family intramembrane glutamic endopeptidase [Paenibacillus albus]AZN40410.1 CPBP family intramembrane metalloprotease [Paenibacillus albus]
MEAASIKQPFNWRALGYLILFMVSFIFGLQLVNNAFNLKIPENDIPGMAENLLVSVLLLFFSKDIRAQFMIHLHKRNIVIGMSLGICFGLLDLVLSYGYQFAPYIFGHAPIPVGSHQVTYDDTITRTGLLLSVGIPAIYEEILARFLPYAGLFVYLKRRIENVNNKSKIINRFEKNLYQKLFIEDNKRYKWMWLFVTAFLFSAAHGLSLISLPLYFFSGIFCGFLFLRYGYLSAVMAHLTFNVLSSPAQDYFIKIIHQLT